MRKTRITRTILLAAATAAAIAAPSISFKVARRTALLENPNNQNDPFRTSSSCRPPPGSTYLTIGQDLFSVADYLLVQYNASLHERIITAAAATAATTAATTDAVPLGTEARISSSSSLDQQPGDRSAPPHFGTTNNAAVAAFMVYTDIQLLHGLSEPVDYGSGIEYADGLMELMTSPLPGSGRSSQSAPLHRRTNEDGDSQRMSSTNDNNNSNISLQIGLWLNGTRGCEELLAGTLQEQVHRLYQYLMEDCAAKTVFLRVGYEFDNPSFGYTDANLYRQAFRFLVHVCYAQYSTRQCREKIVFVWHSWAAGGGLPNDNTTLNDFYPGDDCVDWIGISLFSQLYSSNTNPLIPRIGSRDTVVEVLNFASQRQKPVMIAESTPFGGMDTLVDPWGEWFDPVLQLIEQYDIAMWSYIHCNWEAQPMWHQVGFGDTRLSTNATILQLWRHHVLGNRRFSSTVSCHSENHKETRNGIPQVQLNIETDLLPQRVNDCPGCTKVGPIQAAWTNEPMPHQFSVQVEHWVGGIVFVFVVLYLCMFRTALLWGCCPLPVPVAANSNHRDEALIRMEPNANNVAGKTLSNRYGSVNS